MLHYSYALLCFNDLTGDVCIGMLTERLWMIHIRKHADIFLQLQIASTVKTVFTTTMERYRVLIDFAVTIRANTRADWFKTVFL